jgi:cytochrome c553
MPLRLPLTLCAIVAASFLAPTARAQDKAGVAFFEKNIRPVLVKECYSCHSANSKEVKGGLLLDTREGIRRGGETGKAVVPKSLDDSLILEAIRYEGLEMPPEKQLPGETIAKFEQWIRMGAPDPRDARSAPIRRTIDFEKAKGFWAFKAIQNPAAPKNKTGWAKSPIDQFIAAKLAEREIKPVADAKPETLVRRIYFDLIGLPPTPTQIDEFTKAAKQNREKAVEELVDRLLSSSHFGERWGRHWLDVVRYGESTGMERNATYPYAWRYRDYVISAFNTDKPFDDFIREQIAGDLLESGSPDQRLERLVATVMLAMGPKSLNDNNKENFAMDVVDEQIDVSTRAFLGLTASCARCHDHKFDPIPQTEYYGLAGIFRSTDTLFGTTGTGNRNSARILSWANGKATLVAPKGQGKRKTASKKNVQRQLKAAEARLARFEAQIKKNPKLKDRLKKQTTAVQKQIANFKRQLKVASAPAPAPAAQAKASEFLMAVLDTSNPADTALRVRGEPNERGDIIPRGFLTIGSTGHVPSIEKDGSGRLALAEWIT